MNIALTGGATGIGAAVVEKLVALGHAVTAFDIREPDADVKWIRTDLSDPASIDAALAQAAGPFDALINNAGLPPREGLEEPILKVNYFGVRAMLDGMVGRLSHGAAIVNVASRAGAHWRENLEEVKALMALSPGDLPAFIMERGIDPTRAYNLSKEAVIALTLAETERMLARGLRMNSVSPAAVSTGILDDFAAAFGDRMARNVARVGRPGLPAEVADVIVFLASPESAWVKGQDLVIDGGMSALALTDALSLPKG
ncbi:MAG: SDR family oxidoreductase [Pseudomonadota bacterium]